MSDMIDGSSPFAEYDETGRCTGARRWQFTVPAQGSVRIEPPGENGKYGQFVWETATMMPLTAARKG